MRGRYGVDAPGLVRAFLLIAVFSGAAAFGLLRWAGAGVLWIAVCLWVLSAYGLGMFLYMLWGSLVSKVRGRDTILDLVCWAGAEHVLDVGCGRGLLLVGAAHRLTTGHAVGIDLWLKRDQSGNGIDAPLENARAEGVAERVSVQTADMRRLPFAIASFEIVMSHWAVHNLGSQPDRAVALAEMVRVLRPGGTLLLADIACRSEYARECERLGLSDVRLVTGTKLRDGINRLISFGTFQPCTITATKS